MAEVLVRVQDLINRFRKKPEGFGPRTTVEIQKRLKHNLLYEEPELGREYGTFANRPIIGQDAPIDGGVYLGGSRREAVVVDDSKDLELQRAYTDLKNELLRLNLEQTSLQQILDIVVRHVKDSLPYNEQVAEEIAEKFKGDQKVALGSFITYKAGVCRHQALLGAYLLERLNMDPEFQAQKLTAAKVSVDRKHIPGKGGHAWVRYWDRANSPKIYIMDFANDICTDIEDAQRIMDGLWDYYR